VVFDRAYVDFGHLHDLAERGVFWVTRAKENMAFRTVKWLQRRGRKPGKGGVASDRLVRLTGGVAGGKFPAAMRMVAALVEVDGKEVEMVFLTNNTAWAASSVADLYKARWQIEAFFKQLGAVLPPARVPGHHRQRRALAGLERTAGLRAGALPRLRSRLVVELFPPGEPAALRPLDPRPARPAP